MDGKLNPHGQPALDGVIESYTFALLYEAAAPTLDARELATRLSTEVSTDVVSTSSEITQLAHPSHRVMLDDREIPTLTNIVRWSSPIDPAEFAEALEQTWDWPEAEATVERCRHKLLIGDLTGAALPYQDRYQVVSAVAVNVAELTKPAAIHWEPAGCMVQPEKLRRRLKHYCNVRAREILDHKGDKLMDTLGLAALGLVDIQCLYRRLDVSEVARWLYIMGGKIFAKGDFVRDGETVPGLDPSQQCECRHETALIAPDRIVLNVRPPERYAGRR